MSSKNRHLKLIVAAAIILIIIGYLIFNQWEKFTTQNGLNTLGGIVYINLDNRPDRLKLIKDELIKLGADETKMHRVAGVYVPKNGHKGCIQSHILALRIAKLNNWPTVGIFEDDAELNNDITPEIFKEKLDAGLKELPNDWDVLILATANPEKTALPDKTEIEKLVSSTTSSAYFVNKHYYDNIIQLFEHCNTMMKPEKWGDDNYHEPYALDQKWTELQKKDNWYCFRKDLMKQRNIASTINAKGDSVQV